jgi:hypothetical protein
MADYLFFTLRSFLTQSGGPRLGKSRPKLPAFAYLWPTITHQMSHPATHWPLPPNLRVDEHPGELVITRTWNRILGYVLLFAAAFFGLFLAIEVIDMASGEVNWFGLALTSVATFGSLYLGLAQLINRTTITLSFDELAVRHGPLPWPGRLELFRGDVEQLYVREHIHNSKSGRSYSYSVRLRLAHQRDLLLVAGFLKAQEAKFIEYKIEQYLKLKNQPVKGEWKK